MKRVLNWDKPVLLVLPVLFLTGAYFLSVQTLIYSAILVLLVVAYEFIFYGDRNVYALDGIRHMAFPSLVYVSYTLLVAIPAIILASSTEHARISDFMVSIYSFYFCFPAGLLIGRIFSPIDRVKLLSLSKPGLKKSTDDHRMYEILFITFTLMVLIFILYLIRIESYPIVELIRNPEFYLTSFIMREEAFKLLKVSLLEKYIFSMARDLIIPILITGSLFLSVKYGERRYRTLFFLSLTLGLANNSISLAKLPTAAIFLSLVSFYFLYKQSFKIRTILVSLLSVLSFPYIVVYYVSLPELRHASILVPSILRRIFIVPSDILFQYFRIFPDIHGFLMGRSSKFFSWLQPEGGFNTANYVARVYWQEPQTTGSANAIFLGNFWADFGITGVLLSGLFVGWFVHLLYQQILVTSHYQKTIIYVSFTTALVTTMSFAFVSSSITVLLVTKGLLFVPVILWLFRNRKIFDPVILSEIRNRPS